MHLQQVLFDMIRPLVSRWQFSGLRQPLSITSGAATSSRGLSSGDAATLATDGMSLEDVMKEMRSIREQEESRKDEVRSLREQLCRATSEQKRHYAEASNNVQSMASELRGEMEQLRAGLKDVKSKKGGAEKAEPSKSSEAVSREEDGLTADVAALREMLEETRQELKDADQRVEDSTAQVAALRKAFDVGIVRLHGDLAQETSDRGAEFAKIRKRIENANSTAQRAETAAMGAAPVQAVDRENSPTASRPVDRSALNELKSELTTRMKRLDNRVGSLENCSKELVESVEDTMRETKAKLDARLETSLGGGKLAGLAKQNEEFADQLKKLNENVDLTEMKADMKKVTTELERKINKKEAPTMTQFKEHASSVERKLAFLATKSKQAQTANANQQGQGSFAAVPNAPGQWDQQQLVWCVPYMDQGYGYNESGEPVMYDWWQDNTASTSSHPEAAKTEAATAATPIIADEEKGEGSTSSPCEPEPETTATSADAEAEADAAAPVKTATFAEPKSTEAEASTQASTEVVTSSPTLEKSSTKPSKNKKKRRESRSPKAVARA